MLPVLFPETNPLIEELKALNLHNLTPIEALNRLYEWKRRFVDEGEAGGEAKAPLRHRFFWDKGWI